MADEETPRPASTPLAGAVRVGVGVTLGNALAATLQAKWPEMAGIWGPVIVIVFSALAASLGKWLRNRGNPFGEVI